MGLFKKKQKTNNDNCPFESKLLSEEAVKIVLDSLSNEKTWIGTSAATFEGDFVLWPQISPEIRLKSGLELPTCIEVRLLKSEDRVIDLVKEIFIKLKKVDSTLRINSKCNNVIETNKRGWWEPVVYVSYDGEPKYEYMVPTQTNIQNLKGKLKGELTYYLILDKNSKRTQDFDDQIEKLLDKLVERVIITKQEKLKIKRDLNNFVNVIEGIPHTRFSIGWDMDKSVNDSKLDLLKKELQKELKLNKYDLHGVVSYKLTKEDIKKIENIQTQILYFKDTKPEELSINLKIEMTDSSYDKIISIIQEINKLSTTFKKFTLKTDIEDAKRRYNQAILDFKLGNKIDANLSINEISKKWKIDFAFILEMNGYPLPEFLKITPSFFEKIKKLAKETKIDMELTSDVLPYSKHGCYIFVDKK